MKPCSLDEILLKISAAHEGCTEPDASGVLGEGAEVLREWNLMPGPRGRCLPSQVPESVAEEFSQKAVAEMQGEYKVKDKSAIPRNELKQIIHEMEKQMKEAAKNLEFERAAALRDELYDLKSLLAEDEGLKPWERIKLMTGDE